MFKNFPQPRKRKAQVSTCEPLILLSAGTSVNPLLQFDADVGQQLMGSAGDDTLIAFCGGSDLVGEGGDDTLISLRGRNVLDGGSGVDTATYYGDRADFQIDCGVNGQLIVSTHDRTDHLTNMEFLQFDDELVSVEDLCSADTEYRTFDGTNNNQTNTELGSTGEVLLRYADADYADGVSALAGDDRPSGRSISNEVAAAHLASDADSGLSNIVWAWGQFLDHDITLTPEDKAPGTNANIQVPAGDALFDPRYTGESEITFHRSKFEPDTGTSTDNPREHANAITAWIDGSVLYGSSEERANELREFSGGRLRMPDNLLLVDDTGGPNADNPNAPSTFLFLSGDRRANENIALTSLHTLWSREHNRIASLISASQPELSDEDIFQEARLRVAAQIQAITYNEFLPALLGESAIDEYRGYDTNANPNIAAEFSTAAYRFGHSMLTEELARLNADGSEADEGNIALRNAFFQPQQVKDHGIDSTLKGLTEQQAETVDSVLIDGVRNFLFGPPGAGGFDLAALNIQRGRDHGLADYNSTRIAIGLSAVTDFSEITSNVDLQARLEEIYGHVDNIDLWVGGLVEDHVAGGSMGETFSTILADQFSRIRDADRFWYERIFTGEELQAIRSTTLSDVISRNTANTVLRDDVFRIS